MSKLVPHDMLKQPMIDCKSPGKRMELDASIRHPVDPNARRELRRATQVLSVLCAWRDAHLLLIVLLCLIVAATAPLH